MTITAIYGSNEDDTKQNKNKIWKGVTEITENCRRGIFLARHFNGIMGIGYITNGDALEKEQKITTRQDL